MKKIIFFMFFLSFSLNIFAQSKGGSISPSNPIVLVIVLGTLSLVPFLIIMVTSFTKIAVVLSILRNALGTQQVPPTQIITGLAFILTIFVMVPVGSDIYNRVSTIPANKDMFSQATIKYLYKAADVGKEPLRDFLLKNSRRSDRLLFYNLAKKMARGRDYAKNLSEKDFQVIVPAFVVSELREAFLIGFIIFVPFLIIDLIVSNILLSMGMFMLSPTTVSLPFKLLLFVLVDGWYLITKGLVLSYF